MTESNFYETAVMTEPSIRTEHLKDTVDSYNDIAKGQTSGPTRRSSSPSTKVAATTILALSHWQIEHVTNLLARQVHATATTSRHVCRADARKTRCVLADVRWRWT